MQRASSSTPAPSAGPRLYIAVEDLQGALDRAVELGGRVERQRVALGGDDHWFAIFQDPTGVSFGLWSDRPPARGGQPA